MKTIPTAFCFVSLLLVMGGSTSGPTVALAGFHDGGVATCGGCHVMHNSQAGVPVNPDHQSPGNSLLLDGPASDLCLTCHAGEMGSVLSPDPLAPSPERGPGNFSFLLEDNLNDGPDGISNPVGGDAAGHNIDAPGYGLASDGTVNTSPGGNFPSLRLKCTSCHDPHGNGNYRMLRGSAVSQMGFFVNPAPVAVGLDVELGISENNANHVAYISGMSQWCGNCHPDYLTNDHQVGGGNFQHPTDSTIDSGIIQWYNNYNGSADTIGGDVSTAYLAAVPFEDALNTVSRTAGPTSSSRIMCLTCHRAHASSAPRAGRWDFNVATLGQDGVISGSFAIPNPYTDPAQQSLCFKCHETGED